MQEKAGEEKLKKTRIVGVAIDANMELLVNAGTKMEGTISKFIRKAIEKYFEK